jgi:hypothetical protein
MDLFVTLDGNRAGCAICLNHLPRPWKYFCGGIDIDCSGFDLRRGAVALHTTTNPFVHPLMMTQLNPLYWPYFPIVNPYAQFPLAFGPQVPFFLPLWPLPARRMVLFPAIHDGRPSICSPRAYQRHSARRSPKPYSQSTNTGPGTSIMNIVTFNEIGTDNSTNVQTHKNGRLSCCCPTNTLNY